MATDMADQSVPMLYKFYPLETAQQLVFLIRAIQHGEIWAGAPSAFNDPYDCQPAVERDYTQDVVQRWAMQALKNMSSQPLSDQDARRRAAHTAQAYATGDKNLTQHMRQFEDSMLKMLREDWGVACFTTHYRNVLMWSHYATKHRGVCVEVPHSESVFSSSGTTSLLKVNYDDQRPKLAVFSEEFRTEDSRLEHAIAFFSSKAKSWEYEDEWRAIRPKGPGLLDIPRNAVKAVTLGSLMDAELRAAVINAAKNADHPVAIYQARLSDTKYEIERDPVLP